MFSDFQKCAKVLALSTCFGFGFSCNCSTNAMLPNENKDTSCLKGTVDVLPGVKCVTKSPDETDETVRNKITSVRSEAFYAATDETMRNKITSVRSEALHAAVDLSCNLKLMKLETIVGEYLINNKITMIRIVNGENSLSYELYSNNKKVKCLEKSWEEIREMLMKGNIDKDINDLKYNIDDLLFDCINAAKIAVVSDLVSENKHNFDYIKLTSDLVSEDKYNNFDYIKLISDLVSENKYNFDYIELTLGMNLWADTGDAQRVLRRRVVCKDTTKTDDLPKIYFDVYPELDLLRKKLCYRDFRSLFEDTK